MAGIEKPKPLKVFGRTHYACTRCKLSKIRCSGEKPACANCKSVNKENACVYPNRDRKIVIMESDLNKLHDRVGYLESLVKSNNLPIQSQSESNNTNTAPPSNEVLNKPSQSYNFNQVPFHDPSILKQPVNFTADKFKLSNASKNENDFIQDRVIDHIFPSEPDLLNPYTEENYLLPDIENDYLQFKLLALCCHRLPEKEYALCLINKVYNTYSSEFYLIELSGILNLIEDIYTIFDLRDKIEEKKWLSMLSEKNSSVSLCYLFIIFAFGEQLLNVSSTSPNSPRLIDNTSNATKSKQKIPGIDYYLLAAQLFRLTQEEITYQFIQSALLLALYSANLNRYNTVYNYFGVAVRSAVANGFHRQRESPAFEDEYSKLLQRINDEKAKRLWWSIFVIDTVWASKMNMPVHIEYTDTDVDLPIENGVVDLGDGFNSEILEVNVHLTKYIAKFIKIIYGPNIRTFSINYINTDQFNQKLLIKNILQCLDDLIDSFEVPVLSPYKSYNVIEPHDRNIGNLFLRFHQLMIIITKPLLSLVFNANSAILIENKQEIELANARGLQAATSTIEIILKFYEFDKLFILGFWDSQHLFAALSFCIMVHCAKATNEELIQKAIALLGFMSKNNNINAQNCMKKLYLISQVLNGIPEMSFPYDLNADITEFITKKVDPGSNQVIDEVFNPFMDKPQPSESITPVGLFENSRISVLSNESRNLLSSLINTIQSWDNFKGLPIHIYGTARTSNTIKNLV